jgi:hypothetical protein
MLRLSIEPLHNSSKRFKKQVSWKSQPNSSRTLEPANQIEEFLPARLEFRQISAFNGDWVFLIWVREAEEEQGAIVSSKSVATVNGGAGNDVRRGMTGR